MKIMSLTALYYRCRWLHAPIALLVVLCQRTPAVRVIGQLEAFFGANTATVLRSGFAVAAMGAYNSVTGATALSASPASPASAKTGSPFTLVATVKGAPSNPLSMQVTGTLPPGLAATGVNGSGVVNGSSITISGTPTVPGSYAFTISGWEGANATFLHTSYSYTINVTGTASPVPAFTAQPVSQVVKNGAGVTMSVTVVGTPAPTLQWQKNAVNIPGATSATYNIPVFSAADAASYTVVATNSAGTSSSNAATLTLATLPVVTSQPSPLNIDAGADIYFYMTATGVPDPTYQWKLNGVDIPFATSNYYYAIGATVAQAGSYTVVVTNLAGSVISNAATLSVRAVPVITAQPVAQVASVGGSATFTVTATSAKGPLSYQWYKNNVYISGATGASYTIPSVTLASVASYKVVVSNTDGNVTSLSVALTVLTPPVVTTAPATQSVALGAPASFSVTVAANPLPSTYQWRKNGVAIAKATAAVYAIPKTTTTSAGSYDVVITNSAGSSISAAAQLTVLVKPVITVKPLAKTVGAGQSVTLSVVATGSPAPTYQWYKNLVAVPGATGASYVIASAAASQAGSYTVVVTNAAGSATSVAVMLMVDVSPKALSAGATLYLTGSATGIAPFTVQDTLTVYSTTLLTYTNDHAAPPKVGGATWAYAKVGGLGATLKGTYTGIGYTQTYALTLAFNSPTTGTYTDAHVSTAKVTTTDSGTFVLVLPSTTPLVPPAALAVGKTMHFTGSGTDSGGNYPVNATALATSTTQATYTDLTGVPSVSVKGFAYAKPVGKLGSVKTTITSGGFSATSTIQLLFSTPADGVFFTTGKDSGGAFYEEGVFTITP